ncbi:hypothetical protein D3C72_1439450 [compost metagenome]
MIGGGGGGLDRQIVELVRRARADQQHRVGVDARRGRNHQAAVGAAGEAAVRHRLGQSARRGGVEGRARPGQRTSVMDQDGKDFGGAGGSDELDFHETYSRPRFCAPVVLESDITQRLFHRRVGMCITWPASLAAATRSPPKPFLSRP